MDKAARAALLTAKGMDKTSENIADYVADLLRQGRAKEITDDLMEQADPQRLMHHYKSGNTGMDLPMDKASRMARAAQMGLTEDSLHGTAAGKDFSRFKGADRYGSRLGQENYVAPNTIDGRKLAAQFSTSDQGRVMPLLTPKPLDTSTLDDRLQFEKMMEDKNRMDDFRMKGGYRVSGLPGWGDQWAIDTVNEAGVPAMKLHERDWVTSTAVFDPTKMRSQFARFDPRLDHLAHLNASKGGAMEFARARTAFTRAGGQIAPSKYLPDVPRQVHADGGRENGDFEIGKKYNGIIPQIKYLPVHAIERQPSEHEVSRVSDDVAKNMDFSEPVEATAFRYGPNHSENHPSVALQNGHHRLAAARQTGRPHLPVTLTAVNAKGEKLNALKALSDEIERSMVGYAGGGDVEGEEDGITAYHSSPHDFDQFDVSRLGTGEGNQSYGPGLYFAENPKVSDRGGQYWNQFMNRGKMTPEKQAAFALKVAGWDRDKAADSLQKNLEYHADRAIPGKYAEGPELEEGNRLLAQETQEAIDHVRSGKILGPRTYKVKLNVKPHELIDWDEPLSEQHPNIQAVLGSSHETAGSKLSRVNRNPNYRGDILGKDTATLQELYDHFRSKGIKGIRYNDAGSRHGSNGDGTKNYVMFHHDPVQIVDKYEYGGTVGKEEGGATGSLREKALWPSAQAIKAGTGSREAHAEMVNKIKPVSPYAAPVAPASDEQVHDALTKDKQPKAFAPRGLAEGTPVAVRLDIPAYEKKNTWVVSVHHPKTDFTAGEVIGYDSVAHIGNPRFGVHPTGALNIASGKPKSTIATVHGNWKKTTPEDAFALSQTVHNDPQWRQVGMDPERHSYFYDRETQEPVMAADEALHIGPLVYAKNPVYGKKTDFAFSSGGDVSAAIALTRRFTKDGAGATMALKPKGK